MFLFDFTSVNVQGGLVVAFDMDLRCMTLRINDLNRPLLLIIGIVLVCTSTEDFRKWECFPRSWPRSML